MNTLAYPLFEFSDMVPIVPLGIDANEPNPSIYADTVAHTFLPPNLTLIVQ